MDRAIRQQVELALAQADLVLLVADGREGLHPWTRPSRSASAGADARSCSRSTSWMTSPTTRHCRVLGPGPGGAIGVSAAVGKQSGDLLDAIVAHLPPADEGEQDESIKVAIIGRPNVGKSSLANRLLGEPRYVVSPVAGTTRDAVDTPLKYHGRAIVFIDTAGLRRRARVEDDLEFYSTVRTQQAIERADVCILVIDANEGMENQDFRIATEAWERGCGLVIAVNKWDLIEEKDANTAKKGERGWSRRRHFSSTSPSSTCRP